MPYVLNTPYVEFEALAPTDLDNVDVYTFDMNGRDHTMRYVTCYGPGMEELGIGLTAADACGRNPEEFLPPSLRVFIKNIVRSTMDGQFVQIQTMFKGVLHTVSTYPVHSPRGEVIGGVCVSQPHNVGQTDIQNFVVPTVSNAKSSKRLRTKEPEDNNNNLKKP